MPNPDLVEKVARAIAVASCCDYERADNITVLSKYAEAALKAHEQWLAEQGLEIVCTGRLPGYKPTIEELENILAGPPGAVRIKPDGSVVVEKPDDTAALAEE